MAKCVCLLLLLFSFLFLTKKSTPLAQGASGDCAISDGYVGVCETGRERKKERGEKDVATRVFFFFSFLSFLSFFFGHFI